MKNNFASASLLRVSLLLSIPGYCSLHVHCLSTAVISTTVLNIALLRAFVRSLGKKACSLQEATMKCLRVKIVLHGAAHFWKKKTLLSLVLLKSQRNAILIESTQAFPNGW